ncbi:DUF1295-domain-containing protein [Russula vinacea]|nr:DUF1295-domain-containing protein [Russula vinacea]
MNVFSRLMPIAGSAFSLQAVLAAIFVPQANEMWYDLGGSLGFLSTTFVSLYYPTLKARYWEGANVHFPPLSSFAPRQLLLTAALVVWTVRLGSFLVQRAIKAGGDSRFDEIKHQTGTFTAFWMAQALWVFLTGMPVYLVNIVPAHLHPALSCRDYASFGLYAGSLLFEIIADRQKSAWRRAQENKDHEEILLQVAFGASAATRSIWTGIWAISSVSFQTTHYPKETVALAAVSPLFTYFLLRYRSAEKKWSQNAEWQTYKRKTPVFWPFLSRK